MSNPRKYLDQLFISKVRIKALKYFFTNPEPIHLRAAVRELNEEINAVRRELSRMESIRLLTSEKRGNKKFFTLNQDFVFFDELLGLVHKTFGLGGEIVSNQKKLGDVKYAVLTQAFTRGVQFGTHKIDLFIVGEDVDMKELDGMVNKEEKRLGRDIHYAVVRVRDFDLHKQRRDTFIFELLMQGKVFLVGDSTDFNKMPI